jgi:hypothetical protein
MRLPLVMQGVSKRALQWYSKCYSLASVTKVFTLKGVQTIHHLRCWCIYFFNNTYIYIYIYIYIYYWRTEYLARKKIILKWINIYRHLPTFGHPLLVEKLRQFQDVSRHGATSFLPDIAQLLNSFWRLCWNYADRLTGHNREGIYIYIYIYARDDSYARFTFRLFSRYAGHLIRSLHWPHVCLRITKQQLQLSCLPPYSTYMSFLFATQCLRVLCLG